MSTSTPGRRKSLFIASPWSVASVARSSRQRPSTTSTAGATTTGTRTSNSGITPNPTASAFQTRLRGALNTCWLMASRRFRSARRSESDHDQANEGDRHDVQREEPERVRGEGRDAPAPDRMNERGAMTPEPADEENPADEPALGEPLDRLRVRLPPELGRPERQELLVDLAELVVINPYARAP